MIITILSTVIALELKVKPPRFLARKFLTEIAWRVVGIAAYILGKKPAITKDAVRGSHSITQFSSEKIKLLFGARYLMVPRLVY